MNAEFGITIADRRTWNTIIHALCMAWSPERLAEYPQLVAREQALRDMLIEFGNMVYGGYGWI